MHFSLCQVFQSTMTQTQYCHVYGINLAFFFLTHLQTRAYLSVKRVIYIVPGFDVEPYELLYVLTKSCKKGFMSKWTTARF